MSHVIFASHTNLCCTLFMLPAATTRPPTTWHHPTRRATCQAAFTTCCCEVSVARAVRYCSQFPCHSHWLEVKVCCRLQHRGRHLALRFAAQGYVSGRIHHVLLSGERCCYLFSCLWEFCCALVCAARGGCLATSTMCCWGLSAAAAAIKFIVLFCLMLAQPLQVSDLL